MPQLHFTDLGALRRPVSNTMSPADPQSPEGSPMHHLSAEEIYKRLLDSSRGYRPRDRLPRAHAVRGRGAGQPPSFRGRHGGVRDQPRQPSRSYRLHGLRRGRGVRRARHRGRASMRSPSASASASKRIRWCSTGAASAPTARRACRAGSRLPRPRRAPDAAARSVSRRAWRPPWPVGGRAGVAAASRARGRACAA